MAAHRVRCKVNSITPTVVTMGIVAGSDAIGDYGALLSLVRLVFTANADVLTEFAVNREYVVTVERMS